MKSLFGNKSSGTATTASAQLLQQLTDVTGNRSRVVDSKVASAALSLEGYQQSMSADIDSAVQDLQSKIAQAVSQVRGFKALNVAQEQAAVAAGFIAGAPKEYMSRNFNDAAMRQFTGVRGNIETIAMPLAHEGADRIAVEAFDERVNNNAMLYSVAYNVQASRQSELGEAFYPTVVITPDNVGFNVNVRLLFTEQEVRRQTTGALDQFGRQNIIRAIIDATILSVDQTKLIPVYRKSTPAAPATDSNQYFSTLVTPTTLLVDNANLTTAPLLIGANFSLLAISQTNANLAAGQEDNTDAIDSSVRLAKLYVKLPSGAVVGFDTSQIPTSDFNAAPQGNTRTLQLNFNTASLLLTATTLAVDGTVPAEAAALGTNTARLKVNVTGSIVQDTGETVTLASGVTVAAVNDVTGAALSTTAGAGAAVVTALTGATADSYDLTAYRTNSNRRNRGKLLNIQHKNYLYTVPLLPPITALRPVGDTEANDGNLLSNLITATRIQTANAAVTALLEAKTFLASYANAADLVANRPNVYGAASDLVLPAYAVDTIDCATALDSLTSTQRAMDLQSLLLNKIRDMATRLFVSSGYGPASEALFEGAPPKPIVIIGTDPLLYRYLTLTGDLRLMGDMFDYKIVPSYDSRLAGQIVFSFGNEASFNSGIPNPLHFGNMGWKPELTLMMPMVRNGANVMELTVQPSYRHVTNLPIMGSLTVTNLDLVIGGKVQIDVISHAI